MISIPVPGYRDLVLHHLVLDYNGTLAVDGRPVEGVTERLRELSDRIEIHVITADTFGLAREGVGDVPCHFSVLPPDRQDIGKRDYVKNLGSGITVCIGNGRNDRLMLKEAALGIAVILGEGASAETLSAADVICTDILSALDLLTHPLRLTATLRS